MVSDVPFVALIFYFRISGTSAGCRLIGSVVDKFMLIEVKGIIFIIQQLLSFSTLFTFGKCSLYVGKLFYIITRTKKYRTSHIVKCSVISMQKS